MGDYYIRQLKIAKHYYISQYKHIERRAQKDMARNHFGALVSMYIRALSSGNMSFFETESGERLKKLLESTVKVDIIDHPNGKSYNIDINRDRINPEKHELNIEKATIEYERAQQMIGIHNNNAIISLLIRFENFLTAYFKWIINKYPTKYLNEKSIQYSELLKFDYENLKRELALDAANSIMSQPLDDWWKIIKSHKFDLEIFSEQLGEFSEIYYRRNLIVHNNGRINRQYISGAKKSEQDTRLGDTLVM